MKEYTFQSQITWDEIIIEAEGFDHASHIMFGGSDGLDVNEWELIDAE